MPWPRAGSSREDAAERASHEPLQIVQRALDAEAPYFVDYVSQELQETHARPIGAIDVYTTLDLQLQRLAQDAVETGSPASTRSSRAGSGRRRRRR